MVRLFLIAVLTLLGAGCSRTEFAYQNADWVLEYYARQTLDASAVQREQWQPVLTGTLQHHREDELPLVIAYLDLVASVTTDADSSVGGACLVDGALLLYRRHARLAVNLSVPLLTDLDSAQLSHLADHMARRQRDAVKEYLDPDPKRRRAFRQTRFIERIEKWTGKLNEFQRQQVGDAVKRIPDLSALWLTHRAQQSDRLVRMLGAGTNAVALRKYLNGWWVTGDSRSPEYRQQWRIAKREFALLLDELGRTLTDKQRVTLGDRIGALREDLASFLSPGQQPVSMPVVPECGTAPV